MSHALARRSVRVVGAVLLPVALLLVPARSRAVPVAQAPAVQVPAASAPAKPAAPPAGTPELPPEQEGPLARAARLLRTGEYAAARGLLQGLTGAEASRLHARLLLEVGEYAAAGRMAAGAADNQRGPALAAALVLQGEALAMQGQMDAAQRAYTRATRSAPTRTPPGQRARVLLGELLMARGKRAQGQRQLRMLIDAYNRGALGDDQGAALAYVGRAAAGLEAFHDANRAYAESIAARPGHTETLLWWAELFVDKEDVKQAAESIEVALKYNPHSPLARAMYARLKTGTPLGYASAGEDLERALRVNPNLVFGLVTRAAMALRAQDFSAARQAVQEALARNPVDLEALSTSVAIEFLAGDTAAQARAEKAVFRVNPRYGEMYSIVARFAEWEHRYADLVTLSRKALAIDGEDAGAYATLGINLLRAGREEEGLKALRESWARDRFNVRVFHLLNLYEQVIAPDYVSFDAAPFRFRVHKDEREVLEPYVPALARNAFNTMAERHGFRPEGPIHIEMYARQEDFSVRTTGMPNVGVQGVCFGKVITAVSPRAGEYNWGQILWHELAHVFHLQASDSRVPRWFTEGLAEYETSLARPEWSRHDDRQLYRTLSAGRLPALSKLSEAFTYATSGRALMNAYHTATVAVRFLVERYGERAVLAMLPAFGRGLSTEEALQEVLGVPAAEVDAAFMTHLQERLARFANEFSVDIPDAEEIPALRARIKEVPRSADARAALALALVADGQFKRGMRAVRAALYFEPKHVGAHFARSRIALERRDARAAYDDLLVILHAGQDGVLLRRMLAHAARTLGEVETAMEHARAAITRDPEDLDSHRLMFQLALDADDRPQIIASLRQLVQLDSHDRASYGMLLAALASQDAGPELVQIGEAALFVDPAAPLVHLHLGHGYAKLGRLAEALAEYDQALRLDPKRPARVHFGRALVLAQLGRHQEGQAALAEAFKLEPGLMETLEKAAGSELSAPAGP